MDAVQERRERLKALKEAATLIEEGDEEKEMPELKFRNYALKDENIVHTKVTCSRHCT